MTIALQEQDKERRIREYKSDQTIKCFQQLLFNIYVYAQPRIMVCLNKPIEESVFDIDEKSKAQIAWWNEKLKEYIKFNYSDIVTID